MKRTLDRRTHGGAGDAAGEAQGLHAGVSEALTPSALQGGRGEAHQAQAEVWFWQLGPTTPAQQPQSFEDPTNVCKLERKTH